MKERYLNIMSKAVDAYSPKRIADYIAAVKDKGITEHGFARLTANIGILIANGKRCDLTDTFCEMMRLCAEQIPVIKEKNGAGVGNDFAVKEIVLCTLELEKRGILPEITALVRENFSHIDPYKTYSDIAAVPPKRNGNWAGFAAASEQLRAFAGMGNEREFINNQIRSQLLSFEQNGMYRDPHEPMTYDMISRLQLSAALFFGFDGECRQELYDNIMKSADLTLQMLSPNGEIPFGGRSNQFIFNDTACASLCEFYAGEFKKQGDLKRAGIFRMTAGKCLDSAEYWINNPHPHHVKNHFDNSDPFGCEGYAYFDKYMVTAGSFAFLGYMMCDEEIKPCEIQNVCEAVSTSEYFHKTFLRCGDYFAEIEEKAEFTYDSNGLGRIQKKGLPSVLCLNVPFPCSTVTYNINGENPTPMSICAGVYGDDGERILLCDKDTGFKELSRFSDGEKAEISYLCAHSSGKSAVFTVSVKAGGVTVSAKSDDGRVFVCLPVIFYDGAEHFFTEVKKNALILDAFGHEMKAQTQNEISRLAGVYKNRNGFYDVYTAEGFGTAEVFVSLA